MGTPAEELARQIQKKHGTSYYLATKFFPKRIRVATHRLYAFVREPDELVDNPEHPERASVALETWIDRFEVAYNGTPADDLVIDSSAALFHEYAIPIAEGRDFLAAMRQDLTVSRYQNYEELEHYMYGSAAVVGRMMTRLIGVLPGVEEKTLLAGADALGYAMQLTNFLRDIDEDYQQRNRIYLPLDELTRFGITEEDIAKRQMSDAFERYMRFSIDRARSLYEEAERAIPMLQPDGRRAVRIASRLYAGILDALEAQECNPFAGRARTSRSFKVKTVVSQLFRK
jgi:phytoene synthase